MSSLFSFLVWPSCLIYHTAGGMEEEERRKGSSKIRSVFVPHIQLKPLGVVVVLPAVHAEKNKQPCSNSQRVANSGKKMEGGKMIYFSKKSLASS